MPKSENIFQKAYREYREYVTSSLMFDEEVDSFATWAYRHYGLESWLCTSFEYMYNG